MSEDEYVYDEIGLILRIRVINFGTPIKILDSYNWREMKGTFVSAYLWITPKTLNSVTSCTMVFWRVGAIRVLDLGAIRPV